MGMGEGKTSRLQMSSCAQVHIGYFERQAAWDAIDEKNKPSVGGDEDSRV